MKSASTSDRETIGEEFAGLLADAKAVARSEVVLVQRNVQLRLARAKTGLTLLVAALVLLHLALIAGTVMLAVALSTIVGPLASGLIVLVGGVVIAALLGKAAIARVTPAFAKLD